MENLQSEQPIIWIEVIDPNSGAIYYTPVSGSVTLRNTLVNFATTASYALTGGSGGGGGGGTTNTGSLLTTASFSNPNLTFTKGNGSTFNVNISSLTITSASYAATSSFLNGSVTSASYALSSSRAVTASFAVSSSWAPVSGLTNANLSGNAGITNANLANSSIRIGTTNLSLGDTGSSITGVGSFSATTITSLAFYGPLYGTASFAESASYISGSINANNVNITDNPTYGGVTYYPTFVGNTSGYTNVLVDSSVFTYNPSTNVLTTTASYATNALTASFTSTASYVLSSSYALSASNVISSSFALTSSYVALALSSSFAIVANAASTSISSSYAAFARTASYVAGLLTPAGGEGAVQFAFGSGITGNSRFTYDSNNNILNVNNGATLNATGSLLGTASLAQQILVARTSSNASYFPLIVDSSNGSFAPETLWSTTGNITLNPSTGGIVATSFTGSLLGTASNATFSQTASSISTLNQNVLISGSLTIGSSSLGPVENTLTLGPAPGGGAGEGGQMGFNASGGLYTSASFIDNYQNRFRLLKGTNAGSAAEVASWDLQTLYMTLPGGAITMPARPAFRVTGSSGYNPTVNTVLSGSSIGIDYNQGSYYNNTNGQFTCPVAGLYHVWYVGRTFNASLASVALYKNGGGTPLAFWESNTNSGHFGTSAVVNMAVNDIITARVTAGQVTFDGNDNWGVAYIG